MAGNYALSPRITLLAAALTLVLCLAPSVQAYRICTFKGTVLDHGWRTMTVKSNGQCAQVNVGWRTKFIPNRRPCIGETVAVDFVLEDGYMKATKVVSLTPAPLPVTCYPPPPPSSAVCRSVVEKPEEVCAPPKPVCSRTPPAHVTDRWAPKKPEPVEPKPTTKKPAKPPKEVAKPAPVQEPAPPPPLKEEKKEAPPVEEKAAKTLTGEVVASSPKSLSIRVTEPGQPAEVVNVRVGLKTRFEPFRRPSVGERVKVDYRVENGDKFGYRVQVIQ